MTFQELEINDSFKVEGFQTIYMKIYANPEVHFLDFAPNAVQISEVGNEPEFVEFAKDTKVIKADVI